MIYPMLAHAGTTALFGREDYVFETKLDGVRCIAEIDTEAVRLYARSGNEITANFPDVVEQLKPMIGPGYTLDGEIISGAGKTGDFQVLQRRLQRINNLARSVEEVPVSYVAFDILRERASRLTELGYMDRRHKLINVTNGICALPRAYRLFSAGEMMDRFKQACAEGCEGLIAKHVLSKYYPGTRSHEWLKIKPFLYRDVYIGGYTRGTGRLTGKLGAIAVGIQHTDTYVAGVPKLTYCGLVGTGFTDEWRDAIKFACDAIDIRNTNPFVNLPPTIDKQIYVFTQPILKVHVGYQELSQESIMRFPSFQGLL